MIECLMPKLLSNTFSPSDSIHEGHSSMRCLFVTGTLSLRLWSHSSPAPQQAPAIATGRMTFRLAVKNKRPIDSAHDLDLPVAFVVAGLVASTAREVLGVYSLRAGLSLLAFFLLIRVPAVCVSLSLSTMRGACHCMQASVCNRVLAALCRQQRCAKHTQGGNRENGGNFWFFGS
jgi:hypothetical protein